MTKLLSLSLLQYGFHDAVKDGDGNQLLRCWKFLLVLSMSTSHCNYAKEAVKLLFQYHYVLSERKRAQL